MSRPELVEIALPDSPRALEALGFTVDDGATIALGGVRIRLGAPAGPGLGLTGIRHDADFDGLPIAASSEARPQHGPDHPLGAIAIDHVVALTPDLDRTVRKLVAAGLDHRPSRAPQEFFVLGPCLLELAGPHGDGPRLWGVTLVVADLDAAARRLGSRLGRIKDAVQPGRRIATVSPAAGLATPLALITPRTVD